jgi:hypothetical protein
MERFGMSVDDAIRRLAELIVFLGIELKEEEE